MTVHTRRWFRLGLVVMLVAALALVWKVTPLSEYANPDYIRPLIEKLRITPWAIPAAIAIYTIGTLMLFPHMAMTAIIVLIFTPLQAFTICMTGSLVSGSIGYLLGRLLGLRSMEALIGDTSRKISGYAKKGGIIGITLLRMLPIAPYTVVNIALAMLEVPFFIFLAGTLLGTLPGTAIASLLGFSVMELWDNPTPGNMMLLGGGVAGWIGIIVLSHLANRWWRKYKAPGAAK